MTFCLPGTVLRSSGEWPWTSALGLRTRRYSAGRSKCSPLSKLIARCLRSFTSRSSVGQTSGATAIKPPKSKQLFRPARVATALHIGAILHYIWRDTTGSGAGQEGPHEFRLFTAAAQAGRSVRADD